MLDLSNFHISALTLLGIATIIGYYSGILAKKVRLPSLIGYMLIGVILGPSFFNLFGVTLMDHIAFITEIALGFVAFSIGSELKMSSLKALGPGIISIILTESLFAFFLVTVLIYFVTKDLPMALVFGAMAPASAPAGTVAVIKEYKARGSLTKALYAVVGFDDGLAILIFGFAAAFARNLLIGQVSSNSVSMLHAMAGPAEEIFFSFVVGGVLGLIFCQLVKKLQNSRDIFILVFGIILLTTGLSVRWHLSLILTNMVIGFVLVNTRRESLVHRVNAPLHEIMPLMFILFFCLAGAHLEISALGALGVIGIVYIIARTGGLVVGARIGGIIGRVEDKIKKYVGLGILSQAGVAIGLSLIIKHDFDKLARDMEITHAAKIGATVLTTITATCIFFEIIGPICTKIALHKAGELHKE